MISVIVPVYNAEKYLEECIVSILSQSVKDIELILVNDGSTDGSLDVCNKVKDSRIIVIDKQNSGVSDTRNVGITIAKGDYIAFVDSDDTLPYDALSSLLSGLVDNEADMCCGDMMFQYGNTYRPHKGRLATGVYTYNSVLSDFIDDGTLSGFIIGSACAALYKRDLILKYLIRFNKDVKNNEDGLFNFEYALHAQKFCVLSKEVYNYRQYGDSSASKRSITYDFNKLIKEYLNLLDWDKQKYNYETQMRRRNVSVALWDILQFPGRMSLVEGRCFIKKVVQGCSADFSTIDDSQLSLHKSIIFHLMKWRLYLFIWFVVKYVIPALSARVSR